VTTRNPPIHGLRTEFLNSIHGDQVQGLMDFDLELIEIAFTWPENQMAEEALETNQEESF